LTLKRASASEARTDIIPGSTLFRKIAIIGVGLIGGSLARALRRAGQRARIVGYGRNHLDLQRAIELGVIDGFETRLQAAVQDADMIVVAVPVGAIADVLHEIRPYLAADAVITDVGSTKHGVVATAREQLGAAVAAFVPGHPIAGDERRGVEASRADLFDGRTVLLTPVEETRPLAVARVRALWEATGARVAEMDPERHDQVLAATSHLPHVLAFALVDTLARMDDSEEIFRYAAGGFRDFTRIASSDPVVWRDICLANGEHILATLARYRAALDELGGLISAADGEGLVDLFKRAKAVRDRNVKK
jgi:prephenate dehydrogenase